MLSRRSPEGTRSDSARPRLVCFPSSDVRFVEDVYAVMDATGVRSPDALEVALRPTYPRVVVRDVDLIGLRSPAWYVYRDGTSR